MTAKRCPHCNQAIRTARPLSLSAKCREAGVKPHRVRYLIEQFSVSIEDAIEIAKAKGGYGFIKAAAAAADVPVSLVYRFRNEGLTTEQAIEVAKAKVGHRKVSDVAAEKPITEEDHY